MKKISKRLILALAFLSFLAILSPQGAHAQVPDPCRGGSSSATDTNGLGTNPIDTGADTAKNTYLQKKAAYLDSVRKQFPLLPAMNTCVKAIMTILSAGPSMANPMGVVDKIVLAMINSLITAVCSDVMALISQVKTSITQLTTVCVPLPSFHPGQLAFHLPGLCQLENDIGIHGGAAIPLLGNMQPNQLFDANAAYKNYLSTTGQCAHQDAKGNCITQ